MAERVGFEPTVPLTDTHTFQACALNHSAISPKNYLKNSKFLPILSFLDKIGFFIGHLILTS